MPYITQEYYANAFHGEPVDSTDFPSLCERAQEIIEEMTMYRLTFPVFNKMSELEQERIKKAVCAQIEYLDANGGGEIDNGSGMQSAGLGKFSFTSTSGADGSSAQSIYSPRAIRILLPTGLLYRGGRCL